MLDGVLIANEVLDKALMRKKNCVIFKVDFEIHDGEDEVL